MKKYKNYIFDFYGTLVDISTNEKKPALWKQLAGIYSQYGADYTGPELRRTYEQFCMEEEKLLADRLLTEAEKLPADNFHHKDHLIPEIRLEKVFYRLLTEAPVRHEVSAQITPGPYTGDPYTWAELIANTFRVLSRKTLALYPGTYETLEKLKAAGSRLFILSNAQKVFTLPEIEAMGIVPLFEDIWLSSDHYVKKPAPSFIGELMAAHDMKPDETAMVGNDCISDMGSAAEAGVDGILLNTFSFSKEYIKKTSPVRPVVIESITQLY